MNKSHGFLIISLVRKTIVIKQAVVGMWNDDKKLRKHLKGAIQYCEHKNNNHHIKNCKSDNIKIPKHHYYVHVLCWSAVIYICRLFTMVKWVFALI